MEFSFDRSNDSHRNNTKSQAEAKPEPVAAQPAETYGDGIDTSTIQNERLKKAIERNRARQAERTRLRPEPSQAAPAQQAHPEPVEEQGSLFGSRQSAPVEETEPVQNERPRTRMRMRAGLGTTSAPKENSEEVAQAAPASSAVVTRRSVARPDDTDFTPTKRSPRKVSSQISYSTSGAKKKGKSLDPTLVNYLFKGCWIFCGIMILRLIFANGGVTDFYSRKSILNDRLSELDRIKKENMQLVREIERMQTDTAFQKKLVRDNLGFIAADEFLILFPKEKSVQ